MRLLTATAAGLVAMAVAASTLLVVARSHYYGGHGLLGGFESWHLPFAAVLLLTAFGAAFTTAWRRLRR